MDLGCLGCAKIESSLVKICTILMSYADNGGGYACAGN